MSSATKRLLEEEVERVEKRLRKEYEERLANEVKEYDARLAEEVKKREAAEKKAKRAVNKYHNQSRALTK